MNRKKKYTPKCIISNCQKSNTKNSESNKRKITCHVQGNLQNYQWNFFSRQKTLQARKEWGDILEVLGKKKKTAAILEGKMVKREKPASLDPHKDQ